LPNSKACAVAAAGMGHQIRASATTTTLAVNTTPGHANFITITGPQDSYDWTLSNIVDDSGALRSAFLSKTDGSGVCPTGFNVPSVELVATWLAPRFLSTHT
jgi:hypothetical protein